MIHGPDSVDLVPDSENDPGPDSVPVLVLVAAQWVRICTDGESVRAAHAVASVVRVLGLVLVVPFAVACCDGDYCYDCCRRHGDHIDRPESYHLVDCDGFGSDGYGEAYG